MNKAQIKILYIASICVLVIGLLIGLWFLYLYGLLPIKPAKPALASASDPNAVPVLASLDEGNLILVNEFYTLPDDYEPDDLVKLADVRPPNTIGLKSTDMYANKAAFEALCNLCAAARESGHSNIVVIAAYRTLEKQRELFYEESFNGRDIFGKPFVQTPEATEHRTGLAFDLSVLDSDGNTLKFSETPQCAWITENMTDYGFIIRYPQDKQDITGIGYEPWHFRYVGVEAAREITQKGLCLEEYLGKVGPK